ncbi:LysR family transcriptional regulator [Ensifer adhaerens]|uniref:LysR family transcriptional regulator n=1 Tax=Ensifer adhaerens TaxID=106592 RepID=UPI001CBBCCB4|nr:LysR family transcriptional regulator [Ensifer adhaerens]MBZ7924957.1 LysR family transcriptional regulator [Ensifer adhaerens]UAX95833.1 LysR family transcriptional regulator [Ensifer adhaerens]UAY04825.1 LysR family transcriptional regulator [Ensifer adhaerens]UAY10257.1 LysR family transcriptional regulator [Ensifer adhaerens]
MNIDAIRAFLYVAELGSFTQAAARLDIMQSTVSARIQGLEGELSCILFKRSRGGTELTRAGRDFREYAENIVRTWDHARQRIALPTGFRSLFRFGGPVALQDELCVAWAQWMKRQAPHVALQLESGPSEMLTTALSTGMMDAAIMYLPQKRSGLVSEDLLVEDLILVRHPALVGRWQEKFIMIDWGYEFNSSFSHAFPDVPGSSLSVGIAELGLKHVLTLCGAAYLPHSLISPLIATGQLERVPDAPTFQRVVYLVFPTQSRDPEVLEIALDGLRKLALTRGTKRDNS